MGWSKALARSSRAAMSCAWAPSSAWLKRPTTSASSAIILSSPSRWDWRRVPQIRNRASLGGNVMQRTRCEYFRDTSWTQCNKRAPGSGCAALQGINRKHAVLGVSDQCIATHGGDFAQALISLRATVHRKRCLSPIPMEFQEQLAIHCDKALQVFGAKLCEGLVRRSDA